MMKNSLKSAALLIVSSVTILSCSNQNQEKTNTDKNELTEIFPKGEKGSSETVHLFQNFSPPGEQVIMTPLMNIHMGQITEVNPTLPEWASSLDSLIKLKS